MNVRRVGGTRGDCLLTFVWISRILRSVTPRSRGVLPATCMHGPFGAGWSPAPRRTPPPSPARRQGLRSPRSSSCAGAMRMPAARARSRAGAGAAGAGGAGRGVAEPARSLAAHGAQAGAPGPGGARGAGAGQCVPRGARGDAGSRAHVLHDDARSWSASKGTVGCQDRCVEQAPRGEIELVVRTLVFT